MLAASVILALFARTLAAPSSTVGVGAAETSEAARRKKDATSFIVDPRRYPLVDDSRFSMALVAFLDRLTAFDLLHCHCDSLEYFPTIAPPRL